MGVPAFYRWLRCLLPRLLSATPLVLMCTITSKNPWPTHPQRDHNAPKAAHTTARGRVERRHTVVTAAYCLPVAVLCPRCHILSINARTERWTGLGEPGSCALSWEKQLGLGTLVQGSEASVSKPRLHPYAQGPAPHTVLAVPNVNRSRTDDHRPQSCHGFLKNTGAAAVFPSIDLQFVPFPTAQL